jgi:uncharacterized protein
MFYFDPLYMVLMLIGLPLVFIPQWWVKSTYEKYAKVRSNTGRSGAEVARDILSHQGLSNVSVEVTHGILSDHYDPLSKKVRLSEENYHGTSVAAIAVAAHEVGHAIQHARGFFPVVIRSAMVPAVNLGSQFGPLLIFISILLMSMRILAPDLGLLLAWGGVILFGLAVAFHFVTLPVEIDASMRAVGVLKTTHYLTTQEIPLAKKVLTAAAFTYVATALYALMQLMYYVLQLLGSRQRE